MSAIGIDLGTTNSCVAVYRNGRVEVIANDSGSRVTPSCVSFTESERLIGQPAKDEASMNCENTLFQMKRLIGRKFNDTTVQEDLKLFAFKVLNDGNRPKIQVTYKEKKETFYPEQISAMILTELKGAAEAYMGEPITDVVITVPAYFNDAQRTATRDAGRIAGLNVLSTINEPTAAAIAYGLDRKGKEKRNVLIFDLGGGTFDVTVVTIEEEIFDVRATGGDTHLGGEDFDNKMVQYFMAEFNKKHNVDISKDKRSLSRLKIACELTKRNLSTATSAKLQVDALYNGLDLKTIVSQAKFEDINSEYFTSTITCVKNVLEDAKMKKEEIDDIVLVGGSTRIPNVRKLLQDYFNGKEICREINPDEAVAYGAAAHAQNIKLGGKETHGSFKLKDVTSLSIGTDVKGSDMHVVIPRNTKIPTQKMVGFTTGRDNQDIVPFMVFEGERPKVSDNHLLGCFLLKGIQPAPAGKPEILSIFKIDESGILSVTAIDLGSGNVNNIKISNQDRLKDEEIQKMIAAGEKFQLEDKEYKERTGAINELEGLVYKIKNLVEADTSTISPKDRKGLLAKAQEAIDWVEANKKADIKSIRLKTIELHKIFNAVRGFSAFLKTMSRLAELVRNESG